MAATTVGIEEAACTILESLAKRLPQAALDYECFSDMHHFFIDHAGARFRVWFREQALMGKGYADLQPAISKISEHVLSKTSVQLARFNPMFVPALGESDKSTVRKVISDPTLPLCPARSRLVFSS
jgi:hypothetical protein